MTRYARVVIPGSVHHVTQRGNHRQPVFLTDRDREIYQKLVQERFRWHSAELAAYCWMGNHVHQAVIPQFEHSLARAIGRSHGEYSRWFQTQRCISGHLWGDRFYSAVVEDCREPETVLYIELNPVRAGLVKNAWDWPWSSARAHVTGVDPSGLLDMSAWCKRVQPDVWREMLEQAAREELCFEEIRTATRTGRPLGSDAFVTALEQRLGRVLRPLPRGRPKRIIEVPAVIPVRLRLPGGKK